VDVKLSDSSSAAVAAWRVETARQAALLSDPVGRAFFYPFLARTRSVKEAADELGCRLDATHYRVRRFLEAGLLRVVGKRPRAGRPIKLYRSVADVIYVPFDLTPFAELEERIRKDVRAEEDRLVTALARAVRLSGREGRRLYRRANGELMVDAGSESGRDSDWGELIRTWPASVPVTERMGGELALTHAEAKTLLLAFRELTERYPVPGADVDDDRRTYHFYFGLAPWGS